MDRIYVKTAVIICLTIMGFILPEKTIFGQEATLTESKSISFKNYDIHFFGHTTSSTPDYIIRLDNNGEILLACKTGRTIEQLKANNIKVIQSQIRLLRDWRLIQEEDGVLKTSFPILGSAETEYLRKVTKSVALRIGPKLKEEVHALKAALKSEGYEKNTYSILFSYVLDNLVWEEFEEAKSIMERKITVEKPFWAGFLWAIYPPRDFSCGTNSLRDQGVSLSLTWSKTGGKLIFSIYSDFEAYTSLFEDIKKYGKVKNAKAIEAFKPYNIFDRNGDLTIPIIVENTSNHIYKLCKILSQKVAAQVLKNLNIQELRSDLNIEDRAEIIIVAYHEIMWDLLDYFERQGVIQKPIVFANPKKAQLKDVSDLMFIVKTE